MTIITVDATLSAKLLEQADSAELRDETGRILGYFNPAPKNGTSKYEGCYIPDFSREDLDRWANEPGGRSLAKILADLEKRT